LCIERLLAVTALREIWNDAVHVPREEDPGPMDERILNYEDEEFIRVEEENNVPLRGILAGHVVMKCYAAANSHRPHASLLQDAL